MDAKTGAKMHERCGDVKEKRKTPSTFMSQTCVCVCVCDPNLGNFHIFVCLRRTLSGSFAFTSFDLLYFFHF